jgi:hypothetical protein
LIGVACESREEPAVREFFELFKTPWELLDPGHSYDAIIVSGNQPVPTGANARIVVCLENGIEDGDAGDDLVVRRRAAPAVVTIDETTLPLFCSAAEVRGPGRVRGRFAEDSSPMVLEHEHDGVPVISCGYSLFAEVELLLTRGQPIEHAAAPTLDLHIDLLRRWLIGAGIEVVEIHPTPPGCGLLASLTHDVDFHGIRRHRGDRTLMGFLYRASIGSVIDVLRGKGTLRRMLRNWLALLSLPLVHARLLEDFWLPFDRYAKADAPWRSTFFIVPFRGRPGRAHGGGVASGRAVPYEASEIGPELRALAAKGHEIGVHGLDAWLDDEAGRHERAAVRAASGTTPAGVRMHWLYLDAASFETLDRAGFEYDATFGYNEIVGFRAGTSQVFAPLGTERLLELPLHIQDTSLFYPARMHSSESEALSICRQILDDVCRHGGVATISWHERSLSPERHWDRAYDQLLTLLRARSASVRTAHEVVSWFRLRRSIDLEGAAVGSQSIFGLAVADGAARADRLRVRIHRACAADAGTAGYRDVVVRADDLARATLTASPVRS